MVDIWRYMPRDIELVVSDFFFHILIPHCTQSRICFFILFIKRESSQTKTKYAIKSIESSILRHLLQ